MITLTVTDSVAETEVSLSPSAAVVLQAAKKVGWEDRVQDPALTRKIELKQAEFLSLDPNDPQRAAIAVEVQQLQTAAAELVPNPVTPEQFVIAHVREQLLNLLVDERALKVAAQKKLDEATAAAKLNAAKELGLA